MEDIQATIQQAKADFEQAKEGLLHALRTTPADRLKWSPSPTARSPLQQGAHVAAAIGHMIGNLKGDTFAVPTTAEADLGFREWEKGFSSREEVEELMERNSEDYFAWLDALTPDLLESSIKMPFGLGIAPMRVGIAVMPIHVTWHTAQIQYIQTIYGDQDWHLGE